MDSEVRYLPLHIYKGLVYAPPSTGSWSTPSPAWQRSSRAAGRLMPSHLSDPAAIWSRIGHGMTLWSRKSALRPTSAPHLTCSYAKSRLLLPLFQGGDTGSNPVGGASKPAGQTAFLLPSRRAWGPTCYSMLLASRSRSSVGDVAGHIRRRGSSWEIRVCEGKDSRSRTYRYRTRTVAGDRADAERALDQLLELVTPCGALVERWFRETPAESLPASPEEIRRLIDSRLGSLARLRPSEVRVIAEIVAGALALERSG